MPDLELRPIKDSGTFLLRGSIKTITRWYAVVVAIVAPAFTLYGWLVGAGLINISFVDAVFNVCQVLGVAALFGYLGLLAFGFVGGVIGFGATVVALLMGYESDFTMIGAKIGGSLAAAIVAGVLLFVMIGQGWLTRQPVYDVFGYWFFATIGFALITWTYVRFGKKLIDQVKSLAAESEKVPPANC